MILLGATVSKTFQTRDSGKALANADVLPTVSVYRNAVATSVVVTVSNISVGVYGYSFEIPMSWRSRDNIEVHVDVTIEARQIGGIKCLGTIELQDKIFNAVQVGVALNC